MSEAETIAKLRQLVRRAAPDLIRQGLDLRSRPCAALAYRLYRGAPGEWVAIYDLEECIEAETLPSDNTIRVYVSRLRKALGAEFVECEHVKGYRLGPEARARIAEILGEDEGE